MVFSLVEDALLMHLCMQCTKLTQCNGKALVTLKVQYVSLPIPREAVRNVCVGGVHHLHLDDQQTLTSTLGTDKWTSHVNGDCKKCVTAG